MVLHIPHSSTNPLGISFDADLDKEIELLTDHHTDKLFHHAGTNRLVFPISRLVCDVERCEDEAKKRLVN